MTEFNTRIDKTLRECKKRKSVGHTNGSSGSQEGGRNGRWKKEVASEWVLTRPNLPQSRVSAWKFARQRSCARTGKRIIEKLQRARTVRVRRTSYWCAVIEWPERGSEIIVSRGWTLAECIIEWPESPLVTAGCPRVDLAFMISTGN